MNEKKLIAGAARLTLFLAGSILMAQAPERIVVGSVGPFVLRKVIEGGRFDRCTVDMQTGRSMFRMGWNTKGEYMLNVPASPLRSAPGPIQKTMMAVDTGQGRIFTLDALTDGVRTWATMDRRTNEAFMNVKRQITVDHGADKFIWPIGNTDMTDVYVKIEDCVHANRNAAPPRAAAPAPAPARAMAQKVGSGLFKTPLAKIGGWDVGKFSRDAAGRQGVFCAATVITGQEQGLRIELNPTGIVYGFMGDASSAMGPTPNITYWLGTNKGSSQTVRARLMKAVEEPDSEFLAYTRDNNDTEILEWSNPAVTAVTFTYRFQGKNIVQQIPLRGFQAVFQKLSTCLETL